MRHAKTFLIVLVAGLAAFSWGAWHVLVGTTRDWVEKDLRLSARLAVTSAEQSLLRNWQRDRAGALEAVLLDITRNERIVAAAACLSNGERLAATPDFPADLTCAALAATRPAKPLDAWSFVRTEGTSRAHISAMPVGTGAAGFVMLVHDLHFLEHREATNRNQLLLAFFLLAGGGALATLIASRLAWANWLSDLRKALMGRPAPGFRPLLRDVRALAERLADERSSEAQGGAWTAARLKAALGRHLHGERVIVVANREPYVHSRDADGKVSVANPASGLVTALEPVMRACSGVWVAHGSGSADRDTVDAHDRIRVPPGEESYEVRRVWLSEAEEAGYYFGFSNEGLWPLCHTAHVRPSFRAADWEQYQRVNQRFADAACDEADADDPIILVQDYHFALVPRMIRRRLPRATIITFWHIPWPNSERFGICPWRAELLDGLLGSSIVGFHTPQHCNNFLDSVDAYVESRIDREERAVVQHARRTLVRAYPISIEWPVHWLGDLPAQAQCREEVFRELGLAPDTLLGVGIDRLDYTKGIEERLQAVDELMARFPEFRGRFVFAQLAAPSRTRIERYQDLNARLASLTDVINQKWGTSSWRPIVLLRAHHQPRTVFKYYRAAHLCYVSSLHDGMNLVAKEFVAAREDGVGVLVLSQFTGAARELTEALIVNPYDVQQASDALAAALRMPVGEQRARMLAMRAIVAEFNVYRWAGQMLADVAQLRRRERLTGRLTEISTLARREGA